MDDSGMGEMIRNSRKKKGLTQAQLAALVNISTMSIRRYEHGERIIPDDKLKAIVEVLGDSFYDTFCQHIAETPQRIAKEIERKTKAMEQRWEEEDTAFQRKVIEEARADIDRFVDSEIGIQIILSCLYLNEAGQEKVAAYAIDLSDSEKYQRTQDESSHESSDMAMGGQTPPEGE